MVGDSVAGSFRDPAGHVFTRDGVVYRQINRAGRADYDLLVSSGLNDALVSSGLLIPHDNLGLVEPAGPEAHTIIRPQRVPAITYPYGWCFSQLKDAALLTLAAQRRAREFGMSLKDASAFNVQFVGGTPILIDTLSFERHQPGPWMAYRQYCQHFLAPLALVSCVDPRLGTLSRQFMDGVPLSLASRMLPKRTRLRPGLLMHLHLHALAEERLGRSDATKHGAAEVRRDSSMTIVESLEAATARLSWRPRSSWVTYYGNRESYEEPVIEQKSATVGDWLNDIRPKVVWDLGANIGRFSRMASEAGALTLAFDQDAACVETMYLEAKARGDRNLLPVVMDLTNPSPDLGWANEERSSLIKRGPADVLLALALVHHLAIGNNVPLGRIATFYRAIGRHLIVEFVPKTDPMVQRMLASRRDVFADYSLEGFEAAFQRQFTLERRVELAGSSRVLYWMRAA